MTDKRPGVDIWELHTCPICRADLRYGRHSMVSEPTPTQLAEMLAAHYSYHNLEALKQSKGDKK